MCFTAIEKHGSMEFQAVLENTKNAWKRELSSTAVESRPCHLEKYLKTVSLSMTQTFKKLTTHATFDQPHIHDQLFAQKGRYVHTKTST